MSEEKRTFSRVPVRLKGYARYMQSIESPQLFTSDSVEDVCNRETLFRNSKLPDDLTAFLGEMDRKLDRILGLLSKDYIRSDFPVDIEILELSAAGVKFRTKDQVEKNCPLEVIVMLSQLPLRMASSKGRIVGKEEDTGLYRFEFVDTRESDMEAIVQFVFQQQREQIRNSKK
ncbi:PilZ domain-containing protein [Pseudodesulfovibrio sp. zrk46]|uniref:PilZ domain-containing protein n=1 Tax=Pseudodesulfovibrio sp. zrk46 TaxID=2725288 RepID=UPI001449ACC9|nr:PilZ domain-containing protein [Pseudodesulfovibrio sp. zrk46]QJB57792.1 PilZ domain-containing protein [Pseudodesulfovibrio sp. zrk46]